MEEGRVLIIDDDPSIRLLAAVSLQGTNHEVVDEADSLETAIVGIARAREKRVNVILLDGNLRPGQTDGSDAGQVLDMLDDARSADPDFQPAVVGISSSSFREYGLEDRITYDMTEQGIVSELAIVLDKL